MGLAIQYQEAEGIVIPDWEGLSTFGHGDLEHWHASQPLIAFAYFHNGRTAVENFFSGRTAKMSDHLACVEHQGEAAANQAGAVEATC